MNLLLANARLVAAGDTSGEPDVVDVVVEDGTIADIATGGSSSSSDRRLDLDGALLAPGLIDIQLNGGWGHDFTDDPRSISAVAERLPSTGVTAFVPTLVTAPAGRRLAAIDALAGLPTSPTAAAALGLHFEGPIINPARSGAHQARHAGIPDREETRRWTAGNGVAIVTLAPEAEGAAALIADLVANGVVVAAGHTACSTAEFTAARAAGLSMVTHLFNAMAPFEHRRPGPVGATLADDSVMASLICDGLHVDPIVIRIAWRALGPSRTILVTDATAALGIEAGSQRLGGIDITVDGDRLTTADGTLAGSNLTLDRALRNLIGFTGCSVADALATVTANPARLLGLDDRGTIEVGRRADFVVLDDDLHVVHTLIAGETAWKS